MIINIVLFSNIDAPKFKIAEKALHVFFSATKKQVKRNFASTVPRYFLLALGGRESYENDNSDFEITLHFEVAIIED